jgi:hypothetical protein
MTDEERTADLVAKRLEGKKVRVTYYSSEVVYYETVIEAVDREEADKLYYDGAVDPTITDSDNWETNDVEEEEI